MPLRHLRKLQIIPADLVDVRTYLQEHEPWTLELMLDPDAPESFEEVNAKALALAQDLGYLEVCFSGYVVVPKVVWELVFT